MKIDEKMAKMSEDKKLWNWFLKIWYPIAYQQVRMGRLDRILHDEYRVGNFGPPSRTIELFIDTPNWEVVILPNPTFFRAQLEHLLVLYLSEHEKFLKVIEIYDTYRVLMV